MILITGATGRGRPRPPAARASPRSAGTVGVSSSLRDAPLHHEFGPEAFDITIDRGDCQHPAVALIAQQAVPRRDIAVDRQVVPLFGVADVVDRNVVVLAPEERHGGKRLAT